MAMLTNGWRLRRPRTASPWYEYSCSSSNSVTIRSSLQYKCNTNTVANTGSPQHTHYGMDHCDERWPTQRNPAPATLHTTSHHSTQLPHGGADLELAGKTDQCFDPHHVRSRLVRIADPGWHPCVRCADSITKRIHAHMHAREQTDTHTHAHAHTAVQRLKHTPKPAHTMS